MKKPVHLTFTYKPADLGGALSHMEQSRAAMLKNTKTLFIVLGLYLLLSLYRTGLSTQSIVVLVLLVLLSSVFIPRRRLNEHVLGTIRSSCPD